jgi:hypothetical protein
MVKDDWKTSAQTSPDRSGNPFFEERKKRLQRIAGKQMFLIAKIFTLLKNLITIFTILKNTNGSL